jgi:hypothetical protein
MQVNKIMSHALLFVFGILCTMLWQSFLNFVSFRPVQYLSSPNRKYEAVLERQDFIDLNFRVSLNGKSIYRSPDFSPNHSLAFRESLTWDDSGTILVLEVGGRRLFGYDIAQSQRLTDASLLRVKVSPVPLDKYGFEGKWPA